MEKHRKIKRNIRNNKEKQIKITITRNEKKEKNER